MECHVVSFFSLLQSARLETDGFCWSTSSFTKKNSLYLLILFKSIPYTPSSCFGNFRTGGNKSFLQAHLRLLLGSVTFDHLQELIIIMFYLNRGHSSKNSEQTNETSFLIIVNFSFLTFIVCSRLQIDSVPLS